MKKERLIEGETDRQGLISYDRCHTAMRVYPIK